MDSEYFFPADLQERSETWVDRIASYYEVIKEYKDRAFFLEDLNEFVIIMDMRRPDGRQNPLYNVFLETLLWTHAAVVDGRVEAKVLAGYSEIAASTHKWAKAEKAYSDFLIKKKELTPADIKERTELYRSVEALRIVAALRFPEECALEFLLREDAQADGKIGKRRQLGNDDPIAIDDMNYEETVLFWAKMMLWCIRRDPVWSAHTELCNKLIQKVGSLLGVPSIIQVESRARAFILGHTRLREHKSKFDDFAKKNRDWRR